jgi:hypothetical protein
LKLELVEGLHQNVTELIISHDLTDLNTPQLCTLTDKMVLDIDMSASTAQHRVSDQRHCRMIVHQQPWNNWIITFQFPKHSSQPKSLTSCIHRSHILRFIARLCNDTLLGRLPSNWAITEEEEDTCRALPAIHIACKITIVEPCQNSISSPFLQSYAPIHSTCNVA